MFKALQCRMNFKEKKNQNSLNKEKYYHFECISTFNTFKKFHFILEYSSIQNT